MLRKISAKWILPICGKPIHNGILTFDTSGELRSIVENCDNPAEQPGVEFYDGVIVPGFVNTHNHLELSYMKGVLSEGSGLPGFIRRILETKFSFAEGIQRSAIATADTQMWNSGVQAVGDISNTSISFNTKAESKIKYVTFLEIFDTLFKIDYKLCFAQAEKLVTEAKRLGLESHITLHATYSVSKQMFRNYPSLPSTEAMSIHYMESPDDDLLFQHKGGFYDMFVEKEIPMDYLDEGSSTNRITSAIPSDRRILLVHNSNVTEADIQRMTDHFNSVSWALCPRSNLYIEQKLPPVELLRKHNLNLTIGTDSLSSNHSLSMIEEMKLLSEKCGVPFIEVAQWATLNGAKALGLEGNIGSFTIGKRPGAVLIRNTNDLNLTAESTSERIL